MNGMERGTMFNKKTKLNKTTNKTTELKKKGGGEEFQGVHKMRPHILCHGKTNTFPTALVFSYLLSLKLDPLLFSAQAPGILLHWHLRYVVIETSVLCCSRPGCPLPRHSTVLVSQLCSY